MNRGVVAWAATAMAAVLLGIGVAVLGFRGQSTKPPARVEYANPPDYEEGRISERFGVREDQYVLGNLVAPVTVTVFCDVTDPACREFFDRLPEIVERYVKPGKVKLAWRDNPRSVLGEDVAMALRVAALHDRFWDVAAEVATGHVDASDRNNLKRLLDRYGIRSDIPWSAAPELARSFREAALEMGVRRNPAFFAGQDMVASDVVGVIEYLQNHVR